MNKPIIAGIEPFYTVYSDASVRFVDNRAGYGVVVVTNTPGAKNVQRISGKLKSGCAQSAELMAMSIGISAVPVGGRGTVWSDLASIVEFLEFRTSYAKKHVAIIRSINELLSERRLRVKYAPRKQRSHYYTECHRMSRIASEK